MRDKQALAKLAEPERRDWQKLWADVSALQHKTDGNEENTNPKARDFFTGLPSVQTTPPSHPGKPAAFRMNRNAAFC
jgi:hypothetical protein